MWESLILGKDYSWFQLTSILNDKKNTILSHQMDCLCLLSGISVFLLILLSAMAQNLQLTRVSWLGCFEAVFAPFWFWFAPSCEVPLTVIQIATLTQALSAQCETSNRGKHPR